jgi:hypothetical protein
VVLKEEVVLKAPIGPTERQIFPKYLLLMSCSQEEIPGRETPVERLDKRAEYVWQVARRIAREKGYHDPEEAYCQCWIAARELEAQLGDLVTYRVETQVEEVPHTSLWFKKLSVSPRPRHLWHWVVAVPQVGIVDITGAQLDRKPVRIFQSKPENWTATRSVKNEGIGPSPLDVDAQFCSGDPLPAGRSYSALLSVEQEMRGSRMAKT